jgi:WD40 repeat protein
MLVSGSKDSTLKIWDTRTKKIKTDLPGHADEVRLPPRVVPMGIATRLARRNAALLDPP